MPVITEVLTSGDVELVSRYADILQIGARNMQNFVLLEEVGRTKMPVMFKGACRPPLKSGFYLLNTFSPRAIAR